MRPQRITIRLHKTVDGVTTEIKNAAVTEANNWKWHFVDLPKYENGKGITYTVTEEAVEGYPSQQDGYNFTNTHSTEENAVSGVKTWNDNNDQDGKRPASITINLLANGEKVASKVVTEKDGWKWTFDKLPKFEGGKLITYTITEDAVPSYTAMVAGYDVVNSRGVDTTSISGKKTWVGDEDAVVRRRKASPFTCWQTVSGRPPRPLPPRTAGLGPSTICQ